MGGFTSIIHLFIIIIWLFQYSFTPTKSILDPLDFLALQSIHKSLDDLPGSKFFQSWDFTSDPCNFPGVYCSSDKVISLNLGDPRAGSPGLSGRLDPAIGKLSALAEFTVVPGRIIGEIPDTISELTDLRFFAISRNYLSGPIPPGLGRLRNLRTLDLSYNQLTGSIPRVIGTLPELSNLILCHNHLTDSLPSFNSQRLTRIDLMHNNLSGSLSPHTFPPSLQYLSLSSNQFTGSVSALLRRLNRINYLDLSSNRFTGTIPQELFGYPINNLVLNRNSFSGEVSPLSEVKIPTVDLSYNRLSGPISPMFSTVRSLYLNNNRFSGKVPVVFVNRLVDESIEVLYLQHNYLTGIFGINPMVEIPVSSSLCLMYNCMVPPVESTCPLKAGNERTRPTAQCGEWKG